MSEECRVPLSSADLLLALRDDLAEAPFITDPASQLRIAQDPGDLYDQLLDKPASFRLLLHWAGEKPETDQELAGIVEATVQLWVIKAKGLSLNPGDLYVRSQGGQLPFLSLLDTVIAWVRSNALPNFITSRYFKYMGAEQLDALSAPNLETAAFKLTFAITTVKPSLPMRNL